MTAVAASLIVTPAEIVAAVEVTFYAQSP